VVGGDGRVVAGEVMGAGGQLLRVIDLRALGEP
jgi:hypothetical protein